MDFSPDVTVLALVQLGTSAINNVVLKCRLWLRNPHALLRLRKVSVIKKKKSISFPQRDEGHWISTLRASGNQGPPKAAPAVL